MPKHEVRPPAALTPRNKHECEIVADSGKFSYDLLKCLKCFGGNVKDFAGNVNDEVRSAPRAIVMRFFRKGEIICHQDDPGFTAFYLLTKEETARLIEMNKLLPITLDDWQPASIASVRRRFYGGKRLESDPVYLGEGEIFGEMSCLSRIPRTATVKAEHDCYILEFMGSVFVKGRIRGKLDEKKILERILELQLRSLELFEKLPEPQYVNIVNKLKERLWPATKPVAKSEKYELRQTRKHDHVIFAENDRPDGLYIIRLGMVKIVKNASPLLGRDDILDWQRFEAALRDATGESTSPPRCLGEKLPAALWQKLDESRTAPSPAARSEEQQEILYAINDLLKLKTFRELIQFKFDAANPLHILMEQEAKTLKDNNDFTELTRLRGFNRRLLEMMLGDMIRTCGTTPASTLAIRSSRDFVFAADDPATTMAESSLLGEIGLFENKPRSATCVVHGHPEKAKFGETDLLYIPKDLFEDLVNREYVAKVVAERSKATPPRAGLPVWQDSTNTQRFEELGLMQGQKLMLIDLDRCTRCDKCVEACVTSHAQPGMIGRFFESCLSEKLLDLNPFRNTGPRDGRSRLFLDGPRMEIHHESGTQNYLVPATCRKCKDPICLDGCPVGSIHKGNHGQIVIENWCIGCSRCALNCPYGSIQMHTVGVIPRSTWGWRHWQGAGPAMLGATPYYHNRDFDANHTPAEPVKFAYDFELSAADFEKSRRFLLHIESSATDVTVTVNDKPIPVNHLAKPVTDKEVTWNWEATLTQASGPEAAENRVLHSGKNQIVMQFTLATSKRGDVLLDAGITGEIEPIVDTSVAGEEFTQEYVFKTAVVCDMCGGQLGHHPACVTACPHEAASRRYVTYDSFLPSANG